VDAAVRRNYEQSVYAAQAAARQMIGQGEGGRIIFLGHVAALMPFARQGLLGMSLAMLIPLVKMAAVDLGPHGITVNMVATGPRDETSTEHITAGTPIERITTAQDASAAVAFLASSAASAITGTVIRVDGGYTLTRSEGRSPFEE
jgi:NAD(P)-dependent dehydrogenase (short-subunit alcohol dehydrogenase family)